jgi:hypothetical protein
MKPGQMPVRRPGKPITHLTSSRDDTRAVCGISLLPKDGWAPNLEPTPRLCASCARMCDAPTA